MSFFGSEETRGGWDPIPAKKEKPSLLKKERSEQLVPSTGGVQAGGDLISVLRGWFGKRKAPKGDAVQRESVPQKGGGALRRRAKTPRKQKKNGGHLSLEMEKPKKKS